MQDNKRRALGKGLESLLPSRTPSREETVPRVAASGDSPSSANGRPVEISTELIDRNPFQTRSSFDEEALAELSASIIASGVIQPIVVRPSQGGRFQLIAGERRLLASKRAGRATIPAVVREASDRQTLEMTVIENLQRADLNPMEQARAYHRLGQEFHLTQEQMALRTGKERASVANFLRLLRLPETVQALVEGGSLSFGHARCLLALEDPNRIVSVAQRISTQALSVRQTEALVQALVNPEGKPSKAKRIDPAADPNVREAELALQRSLGLKVRIEDSRGRGRVIIEYARLEDFDHILAALGQPPSS